MSTTGHPAFDSTVQKTNQVLHDIEEAYGWSSQRRQHSYAALRAVLHALRDRLPVGEAADLAAQLPMLLRGLYFEGWDPSRVPLKVHRDEFLAQVQDQVSFEVEGGTELLVRRVLDALRRYVTAGEWEDVASVLPRDLAALIPS
ncbi:MAG: hypothetical protein JWM47_3210 [Acidimicrobiales bacterium]|nr:hypothetical protein [Acidimicrobiales bacterium]